MDRTENQDVTLTCGDCRWQMLDSRLSQTSDLFPLHSPDIRRRLPTAVLVLAGALAISMTFRVASAEASVDSESANGAALNPERSEAEHPNLTCGAVSDSPVVAETVETAPTWNRARVIGADQQPVAGANIYWFWTRYPDLRPMQPRLIATSDKSGWARYVMPSTRQYKQEPGSWLASEHVIVSAPGHGFMEVRSEKLRHPEMHPDDADFTQPEGSTDRFMRLITEYAPEAYWSIELVCGSLMDAIDSLGLSRPQFAKIQLPPAGDPIRGRLIDIDGRSVAGAQVRIHYFTDTNDPYIRVDDSAAGNDPHARLRARCEHLRALTEPDLLRNALPMATTDADGRFELRDINQDCLLRLLVEGDWIETTEIIAGNAMDERVTLQPRRDNEARPLVVHGRNLFCVVGPSKPVEGRVVDYDTGSPIEDVVICLNRIHGNRVGNRDHVHFMTSTDAAGHFRITGLPLGEGNQLEAFTTGEIPYLRIAQPVAADVSAPAVVCDFRLKRGIWAEGRVFDVTTNESFRGEISYFYYLNDDWKKSIPGLSDVQMFRYYWTNANGEFRVPVLPTRGLLAFRVYGGDDRMDRYPRGYGAEKIEGSQNGFFPTYPYSLQSTSFHRVAEVLPVAGETEVRVDLTFRRSLPQTLSVVDAEGKPVAGFHAYGATPSWGWKHFEQAELAILYLKPNESRKVFVFHQERNLAGAGVVKQGIPEVIQIQLKPAGSATGRLLNQNGDPLIDAALFVNSEKLENDADTAAWPDLRQQGRRVLSPDGRFRLDGLVPGWKYKARVSANANLNGKVMNYILGEPFEDLMVEPGQNKDLGDLILKTDN